ncbi:MAG: HK97 gp10 family phage protein [Lysinibacillus sp.]
MARWGKVDFSGLKRMQKKMQKLEQADFEKFCEDAAKELAARLLAKVIKRTPVGQYEDGTTGGTLRRGWTSKSHREAELSATFGGSGGATKYADSMTVKKVGQLYEVEVVNPVEYAQYVEYGHRTRDHQGWVNGRFMMTISADELERQGPAILEKKITNLLKGAFDGN